MSETGGWPRRRGAVTLSPGGAQCRQAAPEVHRRLARTIGAMTPEGLANLVHLRRAREPTDEALSSNGLCGTWTRVG